MWKPFRKKSSSEQQKASSKKVWLYFFVRASDGAVGVMMMVVALIVLGFVGVGIDYDRYRTGRSQMDSALRGASAGAGTLCRRLLEEGKPADDTIVGEVEELFQRSFSNASQGFIGGVRVKQGTQPKIKVEFPSGPQQRCAIESSYDGEVATFVARMFGQPKFYFSGHSKGSAVASASSSSTTTTTSGGPAQIDFLLDVSGSMSTVAEPNQRAMLAALLKDPHGSGEIKDGCVYVCHSRRAVMGPMSTARLINVMNGRNEIVDLPWGGTFTLTRPAAPGPVPQQYTLNSSNTVNNTLYGRPVISLGSALDYMRIKLKSDILAEAMGIALSELKSAGNPDIKVAFHRFSKTTDPVDGFKTVIPTGSGSYVDINSVTSDHNTLKGYFDYIVKCRDVPLFEFSRSIVSSAGDQLVDFTAEPGVCSNISNAVSYITS